MLCEIKLLSHLSQCITLATLKCVCSRLGAPDARAHVLLDEHGETKVQTPQNTCVHARAHLYSALHIRQHRGNAGTHLSTLLHFFPSDMTSTN